MGGLARMLVQACLTAKPGRFTFGQAGGVVYFLAVTINPVPLLCFVATSR